MKHFLATLFLTLLFAGKTVACLNGESKILKDGTYIFEDQEGNVPYGHYFADDESFKEGIKHLDSLYKKTKDLDYLSDKGILLILLKRYDKAIKLYLEIEKLDPGRYSTASNIGTAYELSGDNEKALKWIRKSVEIDPKSHRNSEWIHVKILEAKIKGEDFFTTNFLLNTEFGKGKYPTTKLSNVELQKLYDALYYQLNERISFVKPKEKIVAQLLFDLGNIAFLLGNYYIASADYDEAKEYGYTGQLIEQRITEVDTLSKKPENANKTTVITADKTTDVIADKTKNVIINEAQSQNSFLSYGLWFLGVALLITLIMIIYRRRRKNSN